MVASPGPICRAFEDLGQGLANQLREQQRPHRRYKQAEHIEQDHPDLLQRLDARLAARMVDIGGGHGQPAGVILDALAMMPGQAETDIAIKALTACVDIDLAIPQALAQGSDEGRPLGQGNPLQQTLAKRQLTHAGAQLRGKLLPVIEALQWLRLAR